MIQSFHLIIIIVLFMQTTFKFSMPRQTPYSTSRPSSSAPLGGKKPSFETPERTRRKGDDDEDVVQVEDDDEEEEEEGGIKVAKELKTGSCLEAFGIRKFTVQLHLVTDI